MQKSESIKNIAKALAQFQAEVKNPANTETNPFFKSKYAPLNDILNLVRPLLSKHGLSVLQSPSSPSGDGQNITVTTLIVHESGEWIESDPLTLKADKATAQGAGSAITYARRYALSAMLGISSEDDDDGNYATQQTKQAEKVQNNTQQHPTSRQANQESNTATENQIKAIYAIFKAIGVEDDDKIKEEVGAMLRHDIRSMKELTKKEASDVITWLNEIQTNSKK